jgi:hypothetical protein
MTASAVEQTPISEAAAFDTTPFQSPYVAPEPIAQEPLHAFEEPVPSTPYIEAPEPAEPSARDRDLCRRGKAAGAHGACLD